MRCLIVTKTIHKVLFTNFLPEQNNLDGEWEVAITELSYPSLYQNITEGKIFYLDEATPDTKPSDYYTLDILGLYPSISDIVNEMNRKIQEREKYEKMPIKLHVNKIKQRLLWFFLIRTLYLSFLVQIFVMSLDAKKLFMVIRVFSWVVLVHIFPSSLWHCMKTHLNDV